MLRIIVTSLLLSLSLSAQVKVDLTNGVKGVLPINNGGTGTTSPAAFALSPGQISPKFSTDYQWTRSPGTDLSAPGAQIVSLTSCPFGVYAIWPGPSYQSTLASGANSRYFIHIGNVGTPEDVKVTGGTCNGDGNPGTLQFTSINTHGTGYTLSSSTTGIQEASVSASATYLSGGGGTFPYKQMGGVVVVPVGIWNLTAPLTFLANYQTIVFNGAVRCSFDDDCIRVGHDANYQSPGIDVTLVNPQVIPGINNGIHDGIVLFGNHTRLTNVMSFQPTIIGGNPTFGHMVTDYGDQAMILDGMANADVIRCDATFCGSHIYAPGPFSGHAGTPYTGGDNAAVGFISHIQTGNCSGNGVDWQSGNTLRVSDSVIQGYSQFAIRFSMANGGFGSLQMDNVYNEAGCNNPLTGDNKLGTAGLIVIGGRAFLTGGESPNGSVPVFANQGGTTNFYYIVATDGVHGNSNLLYAGTAILNNTGPVNIVFNQIPSATSYDLLATTTLYQGPFGIGNWAVATGQAAGTICTNNVCTIVDNQTARSSYTVTAVGYAPAVPLWSGGAVLSNAATVTSPISTAKLTINFNDFNSTTLIQTNTAGSITSVITSERCILTNGSPIWQTCLGNEQDLAATMIHLATNGAGANLKGRFNFMNALGNGPAGHFFTLFDSNLAKTLSSATGRPPNDPNDMFIGFDNNNLGLSLGAQGSISQYIGNVGDGTNWKERLTLNLKTFAVPVQIGGGSASHTTCFKADGKTLGFCSTAPASDGTCTCN